MSRFKFINILDTIFISVAIFLIAFAWLQFFIKNLILSLFASTIVAIAIIMLIRWLKTRKYNNNQNKLKNASNL
ncbi:MAG: hypothetical protein IJ371_00405, partial [Clostridia bacterium]|nr:hypothetical protein [Clostridia bacterium]